MSRWHIIPIDDDKPHEQNILCHCGPEVKYEGGHEFVVHTSFDGREGIEWTNEILNKDYNTDSENYL